MRKNTGIIFLILIVGTTVYAANTRVFTDTAGRTITIPEKVKKVYTLSPVGLIMMYALAPEKLAGLNFKTEEVDKKYLLQSYIDLPVLSGNFGVDKTMDIEAILKAKPDVILNMGDVNHTSVDSSQRIQEQLSIPVAVIGFDLKSMGNAYKLLGKLTGDEKRANLLGNYCTNAVEEVMKKVAAIPLEKRPRVYYAEGNNGLQTDPQGSPHTEVLDLLGGINVAEVAIARGYGRSQISAEQLLMWNPETILVCIDAGIAPDMNPYHRIMNDSTLQILDAVKNKKVFAIPHHPFNWFDRPPSVNRIIGVMWLAGLFYPDVFKYDLKTKTKEFYALFYHRKLTDAELDELLENAF